MKKQITDPEVIRRREQALVEALADELDLGTLADIFRERHGLTRILGMERKQGDIIARGDAISYRFDFDVKAVLSVFLDRAGNALDEISESGKEAPAPDLAVTAQAPPGFEELAGIGTKPEQDQGVEPFDPDTEGVITLDQVLSGRRDMIKEDPMIPEPPMRPAPWQRMSQMASDLADMISEINGNGKKEP